MDRNVQAWNQLYEHGDLTKIQKEFKIHINVSREILKSGRGTKSKTDNLNKFFREKAIQKLKVLDKSRLTLRNMIKDLE